MKVLTIVGARPQFIKAAPVSRALRSLPGVREVLVHTGQHYDANMSDVFFEEMEIPRPDHFLGVGSGPHGEQTGRMLAEIERVILAEAPDWVLVYGDTNSTLAGALAAAKLNVPVAHVEAGLRSFNRRMPEEVNRVMTDHLAEVLFAPTISAVEHLRREGLPDRSILEVGDVMYDAALYYGQKADRVSCILKSLELRPREYVLATIHRAENTDEGQRLTSIIRALTGLAKDIPVVLPLHPRTRGKLDEFGLWDEAARALTIIAPVGYLDMVMLEKNAKLIATDSGGVQKEAFFYRVPCATFRDETEWVELVELGWNQVVSPSDAEGLARALHAALSQPAGRDGFPYGRGDAASRIATALAAAPIRATSSLGTPGRSE